MIAIGSDHGGFELKEAVIAHLKERVPGNCLFVMPASHAPADVSAVSSKRQGTGCILYRYSVGGIDGRQSRG